MDEISIKLTNDEALVLFELLARFSDRDSFDIEHQAEERALWNLKCVLQEVLVEVLEPDYISLVDAARERLKDDV